MFIRIAVILIYASSYCLPLMADNGKDDLLAKEQKLSETSLNAKERMDLYDEVSWQYTEMDFDKACSYARAGIVLAQQERNTDKEASFLSTLGIAYCMKSEYDSASGFFDKALPLAQQGNDKLLLAGIYKSIGNMHLYSSQYPKAVKAYLEGLKLYEMLGDKSGEATVLGNLGAVYCDMGSYVQSENYLKRACDISLSVGDSLSFAHAMHNIQIIYNEQGRYDEVIQYTEMIARIFHEHGSYANEIYALHGLAQDYWVHHNNFDKGLEFLRRALELAEKYDFPQHLSATHRMLGNLYSDHNQYDLAEMHLLKALELVDSSFYEEQVTIHSSLLRTYIYSGRKEEAIDVYAVLYTLMHKAMDEKHLASLTEMEIKYETDKKDSQITLLQKEKRLYSILFLMGIAGIILLLVTLFLFIRFQRQKRLRMKEKVQQLEQEKELVAAKSLLEGENTERGRLSRELHDGLGGLLTMIKLDLERMRQTFDENEQRLQTVITLTDKSIQEMRRLAHNLMPESLARFGLRPVLEEFCSGSPQVFFYFYGDERRLETDVEISLYRIACELINNALKHAKASVINVQLLMGEETITLTIQDDGKGFDDQVTEKGLTTVRSRTEFIGATLHIYSERDKGSEFTIELQTI